MKNIWWLTPAVTQRSLIRKMGMTLVWKREILMEIQSQSCFGFFMQEPINTN